jgi:PAS domain S-box-containing protein
MYEHLALRKDGTIVPVEVRSRHAQYHGRPIRVTVVRDISERTAAQHALAASELRFRVAFHASPAPQILTHALDGMIIDANAAYERLSGHARAELVGQRTTDLPVWVAWDRAQLEAELRAHRRLVDRPTQMQTRAGALRDLVLSIEPVQLGDQPCFLSVMIDVTERLAAERALARSEQMFKNLVQSINAVVWEADATSFQFSFVSEQAEKLLGYPSAEWLARPTFWADHIHTEDRDTAVGYCVRCTQALEHHELEYRMIAADGRIIWLRDFVTVEASDGQPRTLRGVMVDITARKLAEDALRSYTRRLEYLRDIDQIILTTPSLHEIAEVALHRIRTLIPCNRAELILTDWEAEEAVIVAQVTDRLTSVPVGYRYSLVDSPPRPALLDGQIVIEHDLSQDLLSSPSLQLLREEGLRARILVPLLLQGRLTGAIHLAADQPYAPTDDQRSLARELADHLAIGLQSARLLAEVRAANARLSTLSRQLIEAQEGERRRIARELHDEIGQALALIKLNIRAVQQMDRASGPGSRLEQSLGIIEATLLRVRTLALDLRPAMLDDLGLIAALRWYLDQQAHVSGLAAELRAEADSGRLPSEIETTCFRVVQEALANIVRHAHAQGVQVQVEQSAIAIRLAIQDDGIGFDAGQALARATQGTSGGLLGMQERVALCGGQLTIESAPGGGTTIRVWIPLAAPSTSAPPTGEEVLDVIDSGGFGG